MHLLPPSQYIFPNPEEADLEGEGLICIGADLSPSTLYEAYTHGLFPGFLKVIRSAGGARNHAALFGQRIIIPANLCSEA